jgi:hypothetical protein
VQVKDRLYAMMDDDTPEEEIIQTFYEGETGYALLPMSEAWVRNQMNIPDAEIVNGEMENVVEFRITEISHGDIFISYDDGDGIRLLPLTAEELTEKICDG